MKIYVATAGIYSDYHVVGVFSSEARLRESLPDVEKYNCDEYEIDEMTAIPKGMKAFRVHLKKNGDVLYPVASGDYEDVGFISFRNKTWHGGEHVVAEVIAIDEQHAVKIVNEMRIQRLASGKWED